MPHDLSLHSGERQTAGSYTEIRADHRYRYEWADAAFPPGGFGLDAFCGNGYGSWLLSRRDRIVWGVDGSSEAVEAANQHYKTARTLFATSYWPFELPRERFDFVVAMESIEHVPDGEDFFSKLANALRPGGMMAFSTPNEDLLPLAATGNHFHFRHYTLAQTLKLGASCGLELLRWSGQNCYTMADGRPGPHIPPEEMLLRDGTPGQFTMVLCSKKSPPVWRRLLR